MTDILTPEQRSLLMSKVRDKDTKPEWILRKALHGLGFRYTLKNRKLPGNPDLVLPKYKTAIFVHGCFWHRHENCKRATTPASNVAFWQKKFSDNVRRDRANREALEAQGWKVLVVWECELYNHTLVTIERVVQFLLADSDGNGKRKYATHLGELDGKELLKAAEEKVRYRIDGIKPKSG